MIRVGFIGFGEFAKLRMNTIKSFENILLVGYYDPYIKDKSELENFKNLNNLLKNVDSVIISVPPKFAPKYVKLSISAGLHVFCEKPAARNSKDLLSISKEVKKSKELTLAYGFNHRQHESVYKIKKNIDKESLGKILWMRGRYGKEVEDDYKYTWRCNKDLNGGGILIDQGIHMIDLMHYLSGGFTDAQAVLSDKFLNIKGVEDNAFVTLYSKKRGFSASIHSTITQWRYLFSLEIFLENGDIVLNGLRTKSGNYGKEVLTISSRISNTKKEFNYPINNSWANELKEFFRAISYKDEYKFAKFNDAVEVTKLMDKIYESAVWT